MNTRVIQEYLKRIERRVTFLTNLVKTAEEDEMHREKAELMALSWVVAYIKDTELVAADHQYQWFKDLGKQ